MATIDIGKLTFTHKGDYAGGTAYVANDVVYYNGSAYIAKTSTTGNLPTSTAHWNTFAAGSGGIWNAGLSLGTASQQIRVNSGANALEFFTPSVSADYVKLETQEVTSGAGSVTFKGFANSIYSSYECHMTDLQKSGTGDHTWKFRWCIGNSNLSSGSYRATFHGHHFNSSSSNNENYGGNWNSDHIQIANWNATDTRNSGYWVNHIILNIGNLSNASYQPTMMYQRLNPHPGATYTNHDVGGGYHNGSETRIAFGANDGFTIFPAGDTVGKGIFALYGRKK